MDELEAIEANVAVPFKQVLEEFCCPVCFESVVQAHVTPCAHNFCGACIKECVNVRHQCPVCAAPLHARDLRPNPSYDRLLASLMALGEEATAKRTAELFSGAPAQSPIEALLRRHLARVNAAYEAEVARVRAKHRERGRPEAALNPSLDLLLQSYENALEETPLPSVNVTLAARPDVDVTLVVPPNALAREVRVRFGEACAAQGKTITAFSPANVFKLGDLLLDENTPVAQVAVPGDTLILQGHIAFDSDLPPRCIRKTFKEGVRVDYSMCKECKLNWLCPECAEHCHKAKGHNVQNYLHQHQPTWACCYCSKKKKCCLGK